MPVLVVTALIVMVHAIPGFAGHVPGMTKTIWSPEQIGSAQAVQENVILCTSCRNILSAEIKYEL